MYGYGGMFCVENYIGYIQCVEGADVNKSLYAYTAEYSELTLNNQTRQPLCNNTITLRLFYIAVAMS